MSISLESIDLCPECGEKKFIFDDKRGEISCGACGIVLSEHIIDQLGEKSPNERTEAPGSLMLGRRSSITINKDAFNRKLSIRMRSEMIRFKKIHNRLAGKERRKIIANTWLEEYFRILTINRPVQDESKRLLVKALKKFSMRGRNFELLAIIVINLASKIKEQPTQKIYEIISRFKNFSRTRSLLINTLNLKIRPSAPEDYLFQISGELNVSEKSNLIALDFIRIFEKNGEACGKDPRGIAAGALYLACIKNGEKRTQKEISSISKITEVTLRERKKQIEKIL